MHYPVETIFQNRRNDEACCTLITGFNRTKCDLAISNTKQLTTSLAGAIGGFSSVKQPNPSFNIYIQVSKTKTGTGIKF